MWDLSIAKRWHGLRGTWKNKSLNTRSWLVSEIIINHVSQMQILLFQIKI